MPDTIVTNTRDFARMFLSNMRFKFLGVAIGPLVMSVATYVSAEALPESPVRGFLLNISAGLVGSAITALVIYTFEFFGLLYQALDQHNKIEQIIASLNRKLKQAEAECSTIARNLGRLESVLNGKTGRRQKELQKAELAITMCSEMLDRLRASKSLLEMTISLSEGNVSALVGKVDDRLVDGIAQRSILLREAVALKDEFSDLVGAKQSGFYELRNSIMRLGPSTTDEG